LNKQSWTADGGGPPAWGLGGGKKTTVKIVYVANYVQTPRTWTDGPMAGSCKYRDEPSGSGATELDSIILYDTWSPVNQQEIHLFMHNTKLRVWK
jgi:hypothetical protein